jgi:phage terminase large subunit-like protein
MRNEFLTKRLNIWTESYTAWISVEDWDKCNAPVDIEGLRGRRCYGAFDLSTVSDMTAWGLCFPPEVPEDPYQFLLRFFVPQEDLDKQYKNRDVLEKVRNWIRLGYIAATPGNSQDYDFIREQIKEDAAVFDIAEIAYDKHNASQLVNDLQKEDLTLFEFGQNIMSMTAPSKDFETKILQGKMAHGGNPVLRWQIQCAEIYTDANGNIKPIKPDRLKSSKRIDGVIVAIMALARAVVNTKAKIITQGFMEL